jgi:hypothetical protein
MATRDEIRAVFADPQLDGMDRLYDAIGEMLLTGAEFENAYSLVIAAGTADFLWYCKRKSKIDSKKPQY